MLLMTSGCLSTSGLAAACNRICCQVALGGPIRRIWGGGGAAWGQCERRNRARGWLSPEKCRGWLSPEKCKMCAASSGLPDASGNHKCPTTVTPKESPHFNNHTRNVQYEQHRGSMGTRGGWGRAGHAPTHPLPVHTRYSSRLVTSASAAIMRPTDS